MTTLTQNPVSVKAKVRVFRVTVTQRITRFVFEGPTSPFVYFGGPVHDGVLVAKRTQGVARLRGDRVEIRTRDGFCFTVRRDAARSYLCSDRGADGAPVAADEIEQAEFAAVGWSGSGGKRLPRALEVLDDPTAPTSWRNRALTIYNADFVLGERIVEPVMTPAERKERAEKVIQRKARLEAMQSVSVDDWGIPGAADRGRTTRHPAPSRPFPRDEFDHEAQEGAENGDQLGHDA
jgi:hypothetical protein